MKKKIVYRVTRVTYNESIPNDEDIIATFTSVIEALSICKIYKTDDNDVIVVAEYL